MSIYMKYGSTITGGASKVGYEEWLDVVTLNFGVAHKTSKSFEGATSEYGGIFFRPFEVVRLADIGTPQLLQAMSNHASESVEFDFIQLNKDGKEEVGFKVSFNSVTIRSLDVDFEDKRFIERMVCTYDMYEITHSTSGRNWVQDLMS